MAIHSVMAALMSLLVLAVLSVGPALGNALDSVDAESAELNSSRASADFSRVFLTRANFECPAVCPAHPGCPACPSAPPCPQRIPPGYNYYAGLGYYKMHYEGRSWDEASASCEREGGYLAVLNSQAEADLTSSLISKHGLAYIHIGWFDVSKEGRYVTVLGDLLSLTGYSVWAPGEPTGVGSQNCGGFFGSKGLNDADCDKKQAFLCELFV